MKITLYPHSNQRKNLLGLILLLCVIAQIQGQSIKKVFFIGNSYTAYNDLAGITQYIGKSNGDTFEVGNRAPGGMTFQGHSAAADLYAELRNGQYDAVILQEQSQIPSFPLSQVKTSCFPYAKILVDSIRSINPACKIVFFTTWGRENGDPQNCPNWEPVCTFLGMNELLRQRYQIMAKDNACKAAPIASIWRDLRDSTDLHLYEADGSHPSAKGSIVAGATLYATLFSKFISTETALPALSSKEKSQILSTINATIRDSLSYYNFETLPSNKTQRITNHNLLTSLCLTEKNTRFNLPSGYIPSHKNTTLQLSNSSGQILFKIPLNTAESFIDIPIDKIPAGSYLLSDSYNFYQPLMVVK